MEVKAGREDKIGIARSYHEQIWLNAAWTTYLEGDWESMTRFLEIEKTSGRYTCDFLNHLSKQRVLGSIARFSGLPGQKDFL